MSHRFLVTHFMTQGDSRVHCRPDGENSCCKFQLVLVLPSWTVVLAGFFPAHHGTQHRGWQVAVVHSSSCADQLISGLAGSGLYSICNVHTKI